MPVGFDRAGGGAGPPGHDPGSADATRRRRAGVAPAGSPEQGRPAADHPLVDPVGTTVDRSDTDASAIHCSETCHPPFPVEG
jgi:hypothetical protein